MIIDEELGTVLTILIFSMVAALILVLFATGVSKNVKTDNNIQGEIKLDKTDCNIEQINITDKGVQIKCH